ncbi:hypothetical protein Tco_1081512 [Tanacetum coccineum]|uniref:Uncharacterized protein n=1 Tax=Tanacetum coccineum TaxID=301880 RepID=A0ABQ5HZE9_9ASTR
MKAKLALLEVSPSSSQNPKTFQPKNKGLVVETFYWDEEEEEVSDKEEVTRVKVLIALADDELTIGKSHAHNGELVDITIRKRHIREPIWYLDSGCLRSMTGVKSYLHKYVEQLGPKVVFGDNLSHPQISLQQKTGFEIVTSWREEDLIREIDLYMPIYQCRLHTFHKIEHLRKTLLKCQHKVGEFIGFVV